MLAPNCKKVSFETLPGPSHGHQDYSTSSLADTLRGTVTNSNIGGVGGFTVKISISIALLRRILDSFLKMRMQGCECPDKALMEDLDRELKSVERRILGIQ